MKQLIFDIETLDKNSECIILCASFLIYDLIEDSNTNLKDLEPKIKTFKLCVESQQKMGRTTSKETIDWWKTQLKESPHLKSILLKSENDLTPVDFYSQLNSWLKSEGYNKRNHFAWQRGTLDIMAIDSLFNMCNYKDKDYPILWWKVRELRTAIDLLGDTQLNGYVKNVKEKILVELPNFTKHNPIHDILLEVFQLREIGLFKN